MVNVVVENDGNVFRIVSIFSVKWEVIYKLKNNNDILDIICLESTKRLFEISHHEFKR